MTTSSVNMEQAEHSKSKAIGLDYTMNNGSFESVSIAKQKSEPPKLANWVKKCRSENERIGLFMNIQG
eukprot:CAMPEP_0184492080 /NCGR_PEP_ID=MMETSP0113_2-20130426/22241_1 /TAXON_ID=91329 /ORGANISM="Norrisiella sphaerica, Strain BC52" /LENGTH=67 /DNA_ID=CAMNT_0026876717 /DNA_START=30 /DNA_END=229 /DNA_ORIENTATION=+